MTSAEAGGFAAAKEGLKAIGAQTQSINQQVSAGKLALDPQVAEDAAKRVEEEIEALQKLYRRAEALRSVRGLGDYPDGQQLMKRFQDKAADGDAGALKLIRDLQEELQKQADAFRGAARDYRAVEEQNADDIRRGM
ncbi:MULTISPECIES: hypothetical protein [unclassified Saccharopolyspora]|uniref:hypothetical protein n=1 Tax=unclassified Saccharopolyspora TaxID=2646250 RepID=UPI001CD7F0B8|nr:MULTISPECIES: hypothetical protein [unclassified Saccharopolyspora]MCA1185522.1 hypothetical protein [Saccharopolyspora sp. 6T]MCA1283625.1 hypothetical protein [Saccharopolyspora sp. 7B]